MFSKIFLPATPTAKRIINQFLVNVPILYPLKTPENERSNNEEGLEFSLPKTLFFNRQMCEKPNFPKTKKISVLLSWTCFDNPFATVTSLS